jgi:hypothetical protein
MKILNCYHSSCIRGMLYIITWSIEGNISSPFWTGKCYYLNENTSNISTYNIRIIKIMGFGWFPGRRFGSELATKTCGTHVQKQERHTKDWFEILQEEKNLDTPCTFEDDNKKEPVEIGIWLLYYGEYLYYCFLYLVMNISCILLLVSSSSPSRLNMEHIRFMWNFSSKLRNGLWSCEFGWRREYGAVEGLR